MGPSLPPAPPALVAQAASAPATPAGTPGLSEEDLKAIQQLDTGAAPGPTSEPTLQRSLQSLNPDISFILDAGVAGFSVDKPLQAGDHDLQRNGFALQQLEMGIGAAVDPFLRFDGNLVYKHDGVEVEEAYATSLGLPYDLQARAGQFLDRFGRLNPTHPHTWEFVDQPFVMSKFFGGDGLRGLGVEGSWLAPVPWYAEVVGSVTEATGDTTARSFYGAKDPVVYGPQDQVVTTALKQFFPLSQDLALSWGLSGAFGPNALGVGTRTNIVGTDVYLKYRPLAAGSSTVVSFTGEGLLRERLTPVAPLVDYGGYGSLFWRFAEQWGTAARFEYGSGVANDPLDPDWSTDRERYAADLTFWPTEFSRFRLEGSVDHPAWLPGNTYGVMLTMETVVGAHGAHAF